jgi:hypothetical protein
MFARASSRTIYNLIGIKAGGSRAPGNAVR